MTHFTDYPSFPEMKYATVWRRGIGKNCAGEDPCGAGQFGFRGGTVERRSDAAIVSKDLGEVALVVETDFVRHGGERRDAEQ
jgi:hypothetical protein